MILQEDEDGKLYRLREGGSLWGCYRCQDSDHASCHGCSCPCGDSAISLNIERVSWEKNRTDSDTIKPHIDYRWQNEDGSTKRCVCYSCLTPTDIRDTFFLMSVSYCPTCAIKVAKKR